MKRVSRSTMLWAAVALILLDSVNLPQAIADSPFQTKDYKSGGGPSPKPGRVGTIRYVPGGGAPPRGTRLGGRRGGSCQPNSASDRQVVALAPEIDVPQNSNVSVKAPSGQTSSDHPTLWFYVPYTRLDVLTVKTVEFTLNVEEGDRTTPYRTKVNLPEKPGVIGVQMPPNFPALKIDQWYTWSFSVICNDSTDSDRAEQVTGLIQRVALAPAVKQQIETASPQEQVRLYAENGIWFDALTTLGELRRANPIDSTLQEAWSRLLEGGGLQTTASEPIAK
ncbi:DUF928 domain-containing protein [Kovacikia minuta CCNUW1]|uniref:DUF928 domain-containing protein n=1 Tax=Kovacikia minuta TaxID=2931930 RepID=UPI001CCAA2FC|nr:DUF928 domain-containing protein [Kovacikia minuta]UBF25622.1 DUF928 domain-containing protein [Kovacikia minuta CCNUW1]